MATVEQALIQYLLDDAPLVALVDVRISPTREQGGALPALTLTRISGAPEYADDGEVGLQEARVQIDCWASTYGEAKNVAIAVTNRLSAVRDVVQDGLTFLYITLDNEQDFREGGSENFEYLHRVCLDFLVWSDF